MNNKQIKKCKEIADHYGQKTQEFQTISELSELLQVLTRRQSQRGTDWKEKLIDEIADVYITIQQIIDIHDLNKSDITERIDFKLDRQLERIREEG